jgi:hypothetical protein
MKRHTFKCHKCGRLVGPDGYIDDLELDGVKGDGGSSLCAKHLAEFVANLDHCADVFFGEQQGGADETPRPDDQTA